ncbi:hypothetical protein [Companilactobacillus hulinensis]|nr:hypothetical protein [Companilactobacillus hulinensis]
MKHRRGLAQIGIALFSVCLVILTVLYFEKPEKVQAWISSDD